MIDSLQYSHRLLAMDITIPIGEFKNRCLSLLDELARTGGTLLVTKRGKALARIQSAAPPPGLEGSVLMADDIVRPAIPEGDWDLLQ